MKLNLKNNDNNLFDYLASKYSIQMISMGFSVTGITHDGRAFSVFDPIFLNYNITGKSQQERLNGIIEAMIQHHPNFHPKNKLHFNIYDYIRRNFIANDSSERNVAPPKKIRRGL